MSDAEQLGQRFADLIAFLDKANDRALAGEIGALGNLEKTISDLCKDVEKSGAETAKTMQPLLAEMISKLDTLEQNLRALKDRQPDA
jgi:hypothetical protein